VNCKSLKDKFRIVILSGLFVYGIYIAFFAGLYPIAAEDDNNIDNYVPFLHEPMPMEDPDEAPEFEPEAVPEPELEAEFEFEAEALVDDPADDLDDKSDDESDDKSDDKSDDEPVPEIPDYLILPPIMGNLVFVIDDAGNSLIDLEPFLNFPGAITIAVLPGLPNSAETASRVRNAGKELILHQPMESLGGSNPGPGAIYNGMGREEIREIVNRNLDELWPVAGMNNHAGSRITMDEEIMEIILEICMEREIFFLDSRTTANTVVPALAQRMGLTIAERNFFLDNEQDPERILYYINLGLVRAEQRGFAIMIGHTWSVNLAALLINLYPDLLEQGYVLSTIADILNTQIIQSQP